MYSYTSLSTLSLLSSLIASIDAYPTQSYLGPSSPDAPNHQQLHTLYTSTPRSPNSQPVYPSRSGSLTIQTARSLTFTLTSTCPQLFPDWSFLASELLTNILLLYPTGPTSSPYYTFTPGRGSSFSSTSTSSSTPPTHDTYSLTSTLTLPIKPQPQSQSPKSEFRSTLHLSITPLTPAGISNISTEEWRRLLQLLHSSHETMSKQTKGKGRGRLEMEENTPTLKWPLKARCRTKEAPVSKATEPKNLGPSDIIFPSCPRGSPSPSKRPVQNSRSLNRALLIPSPPLGSPSCQETQTSTSTSTSTSPITFTWKATWINYGFISEASGNEELKGCAQMPLGVAIEFERKREDDEERGRVDL